MPAPVIKESASASTRARDALRRCSIPSRDADGWGSRWGWASPGVEGEAPPAELRPAGGGAGDDSRVVSDRVSSGPGEEE